MAKGGFVPQKGPGPIKNRCYQEQARGEWKEGRGKECVEESPKESGGSFYFHDFRQLT